MHRPADGAGVSPSQNSRDRTISIVALAAARARSGQGDHRALWKHPPVTESHRRNRAPCEPLKDA